MQRTYFAGMVRLRRSCQATHSPVAGGGYGGWLNGFRAPPRGYEGCGAKLHLVLPHEAHLVPVSRNCRWLRNLDRAGSFRSGSLGREVSTLVALSFDRQFWRSPSVRCASVLPAGVALSVLACRTFGNRRAIPEVPVTGLLAGDSVIPLQLNWRGGPTGALAHAGAAIPRAILSATLKIGADAGFSI